MAGVSADAQSSAVIAGAGARTPSGLTALQVTMSARALKFAPRPSHMVDRTGKPIGTARLASIGDAVTGFDRLLALAAPALVQAAYPWTAVERPGTGMPVFVALPPQTRPGFDPRLPARFLDALEARARLPFDRDRSRLVFGCRGGGAAAIDLALAEIRRGAPAVIAGGVDSWFQPDALEHLDLALRLHGPDTENGFVPGEGAGFVLLVGRRASAGLERLGHVVAAVVEQEPRPFGSAEPCLGDGITRAVRRAAAAAGAKARRIPWALTDVTNERHRVDDWMYALGRNAAAFTDDVRHEQPLLKTGDLGAASAAVLLVIAATRWQTGCAPGDTAMIVTSSDGPERGAVVARAAA